MKYPHGIALACLAVALSGCATPNPGPNVSPPRIALVGDSWAVMMRWHRGFAKAYHAEGYRMRQVRYVAIGWPLLDGPGTRLASAGFEAEDLNTPEYKRDLREILNRFPTIEVIHLSAGGADVLHDMDPEMTYEERDAHLRDHILPSIRGIIEYIQTEFPDKHIALVGYDYVNLRDYHEINPRAQRYWTKLRGPEAAWLNVVIKELNAVQRELAASYPEIPFIDHLGHAKERLDVPQDMTEPTPRKGVWVDGLHLSRSGNVALAKYCLDQAYHDWIGPLTDVYGDPLTKRLARARPVEHRREFSYGIPLRPRTSVPKRQLLDSTIND